MIVTASRLKKAALDAQCHVIHNGKTFIFNSKLPGIVNFSDTYVAYSISGYSYTDDEVVDLTLFSIYSAEVDSEVSFDQEGNPYPIVLEAPLENSYRLTGTLSGKGILKTVDQSFLVNHTSVASWRQIADSVNKYLTIQLKHIQETVPVLKVICWMIYQLKHDLLPITARSISGMATLANDNFPNVLPRIYGYEAMVYTARACVNGQKQKRRFDVDWYKERENRDVTKKIKEEAEKIGTGSPDIITKTLIETYDFI
jgi:hypothetical protein